MGKIVAKVDRTELEGNIAAQLLYKIPAGEGGMYRFSFILVLTRAPSANSIMPALMFRYNAFHLPTVPISLTPVTNSESLTPAVSGVGIHMGGIPSGRGGITGLAGLMIAPNSDIYWETHSGTSGGAPEMQYAVHIRVEYVDAPDTGCSVGGSGGGLTEDLAIYLAAAQLHPTQPGLSEIWRELAIRDARLLLDKVKESLIMPLAAIPELKSEPKKELKPKKKDE